MNKQQQYRTHGRHLYAGWNYCYYLSRITYGRCRHCSIMMTILLKARFTSASGLREGAYVEMAGVTVGKVKQIYFQSGNLPG